MPSTMVLAVAMLALLPATTATVASRRPPVAGWIDSTPQAVDTPRSLGRGQRKPKIVHLPSPSQESSAQRDRRLARECRSLPNAGACLGYGPSRRR